MLSKRIITALLLLPLVGYLLFYVDLATFALGISLVMLIAAWEWSRLMGLHSIIGQMTYVIAIQLIMLAVFYLVPNIEFWPGAPKPQLLNQFIKLNYLPLQLLLLGAFWWIVSFLTLISGKANWLQGDKKIIFRGLAGILIIIPTWISLISLRAVDILHNNSFGSGLLLFVFLQIWGADTGAFFSGKTFGKTKLAPVVSPKKTWEGVIGGAILSLILAYSTANLFSVSISINWLWLVSMVIVMFSIVGDLTESIYKRQQNIKDSSQLLPGHGGILDRIDSITSAMPIFALIFYWLYQ